MKSQWMHWSEGMAELIALEDKYDKWEAEAISHRTYWLDGVAHLIRLEDKWKAISQWTYPSEGVADLIPLEDSWKPIFPVDVSVRGGGRFHPC